ncbi:MAG: biopolymer transporter ExbD [Parachlamydiaceae bacterium]|nr:biopolymer transporter ExbD [Parachlamydiaceae bacterium]
MSRFTRLQITHDEAEEPAVNLTPLIDVVFVILIIFIVIAPLLELDNIALADSNQGPNKTSLSVEKTSLIAIQVRSNNEIWLNAKKISLPELQIRLKEAKTQFPTAIPQLFHDKQAHFGIYQAIKNAAEGAGFSEMEIVLKP